MTYADSQMNFHLIVMIIWFTLEVTLSGIYVYPQTQITKGRCEVL